MNRQRTSFSIQRTGDVNKLLSFLKDLRPTTIGVMDDPGLLKRIMQEVGGIQVGWYRPYREDDGAFWQFGTEPIDWLISRWENSGLRNVPNTFLSVMCEPAANDPVGISSLVAWTVTAMKALRSKGIRAVVLNAQPSVFNPQFVREGYFDALLYELADGYHILGWHEYGGAIPPKGTFGGNKFDMLRKQLVQPAGWPSLAQVKGPPNDGNWLIGRFYWWDDRARQLKIKPPMKVITEAGQDSQGVYNDIDTELRNRYGVPSPHVALRGWNTWKNVYEDYYRDTFPAPVHEYTQLAFMEWWNNIYDNTVIGINYFIWSPDSYDWDTQFGFDYSKAYTLQALLVGWTKELDGGTPAPDPKPEPPPSPLPEGTITVSKLSLQALYTELNIVFDRINDAREEVDTAKEEAENAIYRLNKLLKG